jgi:crotonobetaine/carnitine-CoA ligase
MPSAVRTPEPTVQIDHIPGLVENAAHRWPDDEAARFDLNQESLTYADLHTRTNAIAHQLVELGVRPGDRVAVMCRNRAEFPLAWIGIVKARAIMVPINTFAMESDAGHIVGHSGARVMIVEEKFSALAAILRASTNDLETVLVAAGSGASEVGEALSTGGRDAPPYQRYVDHDLANIQYTSGTTGKPKGCMLSNRYWARLSRLVIDNPPHLDRTDVLLTAQPFSYMDPQWNLLAGLQIGALVVLVEDR